jgi:hypothetical protein
MTGDEVSEADLQHNPVPSAVAYETHCSPNDTTDWHYVSTVRVTKPKSVNGKDDTSSRRLIEWADGAQNHPRRSSPNR